MKTRSSKSVLMMALLLGSSAFAETVKVYSLDPAANILMEKSPESKPAQTARRAQSEPLSIQTVDNGKWMKVERENGGSGYVQKSDLKEVEIRKTFVIRNDASLKAGRVASTSDAKKPLDIILTGHKKATTETDGSGQKKTIMWHQVVANGKSGWVAGGALNIVKDKAADSTKVAAAKPAVKEAKAVAPKANETKPVTKAADGKPGATGKVADGKPGAPGKVADTKAAPVKAADAPGAKQAAAVDTKAAQTEAKRLDEAKKLEEAKAAQTAQPNAKAQTDGPECVRKESEYKASARMQKVFGANNMFTTWSGNGGSNIVVENGNLTVLAGPMGERLGFPAKTPAQLCIDKSNKPYILTNATKAFIDMNGQSVKLGSSGMSNTYSRQQSTVRAAR